MATNIGAFGENFPYTNTHDLNMDWIIRTLKEVLEKVDKAISSGIKFADPIQWNITKQYEVLTIVVNNNSAYLSMKPVPTGIDINNTEYWQNIFDMSELYEQIDELESELESMHDELTNEITALDNVTLKTNATKHLLYLGDSYSTWYNNELYNKVVNLIGIPASQCHNLAVSGASFQDATNSYLMQVMGYQGNKEEITDILIVGGINDALVQFNNYSYSYPDVSAVTSAMDTFATYCRANYPNAKLHTAYVGGTLPSSQYYETLHPEKSQEWAKWCYTVFALDHGYNVLDTWNTIHTSKVNYNTDGLHPSNYGTTAIATSIATSFNGRKMDNSRPQIVATIQATGNNTRNIAAFCWIENEIASMSIPDDYILIEEDATIGNDDFYPILTLDANNTYQYRTPHYYNINVSLSGFVGLTNPVICPAVLKVENGIISIKIMYLLEGTYQTLTAGTFSAITLFSIPNIVAPLWEIN